MLERAGVVNRAVAVVGRCRRALKGHVLNTLLLAGLVTFAIMLGIDADGWA